MIYAEGYAAFSFTPTTSTTSSYTSLQKPPAEGYPAYPRTIGEHIRKRRLDLGLRQQEVGRLLGVRAWSVQSWEVGRHEPAAAHWPGLLAFLGYDPHDEPVPLAEKLQAVRRAQGWTTKEMVGRLGVSPSTRRQWLAGALPWNGRCRAAVRKLLHEHGLGDRMEWAAGAALTDDPRTVGERLRRRRLELGLLQRALAALLGVGKTTLQRWEWKERGPSLRRWPAILRFLSSEPSLQQQTPAERFRGGD